MNINLNVNINAPELCASINNLAAAMMLQKTTTATTLTEKQETDNSNFTFKLADTAASETDKPEPETDAKKDTTDKDSTDTGADAAASETNKPETDAKKDTTETVGDGGEDKTDEYYLRLLNDVKTKLGAHAQAGKQAAVKALIQSFGAAKVSDVPKEKLQELLTAAGAL